MTFDLFQFSAVRYPAAGFIVIHGDHRSWMVGLAYLVAVVASFVALDIVRHATLSHRLRRIGWQVAGAFCLGGGIWSMHSIAMLAFRAPITIRFDIPITLLSLALAMAASMLALRVISRERRDWWLYLVAAIILGLGIAAMHYTGMGAVRSVASVYYAPGPFAVSILVSMGATFVALLLAFYFPRQEGRQELALKVLSSLMLGAAIAGTHFTGMAAYALVVPVGTPMMLNTSTHDTWQGLVVVVVTLFTISVGLVCSWVEKLRTSSEERVQRLTTQLSEMTYYDGLTNLFNKDALADMFETLIRRENDTACLAVIYVDLDHFKRINDNYGFAMADRVLRLAAERIRNATHANDIVGRFAGDEFCVLAVTESQEGGLRLGERILDRMQRPFSVDGEDFQLSASVGISLWPQQGNDFQHLVRQANIATSAAKRRGRGQVQLFADELEADARAQLQLEQDLRRALLTDGLQVYYQPILRPDGEVSKMEALVRWNHPQHGMIPPDRFIGMAEATGLITDLDLWVLRRALTELKSLHESGFQRLRVSVNCSPINLSLPKLPNLIQRILEETGMAPETLVLEVTENALMDNLTTAVASLKRLREMGVGISVDDFGSGYSSLAYLRKLPLDTLKVDRLFVREIPSNAEDMEITSAIIAMAHKLKLRVVAEGVETQAQMNFLQANGCDLLQGFFFGRPMPLADLEAYLRRVVPVETNDWVI